MRTEKTLTIVFSNNAGLLTRIALILERRSYTMHSMYTRHDGDYSEMHIVISGPHEKLGQIKSQINKLIDVIEVQEIAAEDYNWLFPDSAHISV